MTRPIATARQTPWDVANPRTPLVWAAVFAALGILLDQLLPLSLSWLLAATVITLAAGMICSSKRTVLSTGLILVGVAALFASWHHVRWNTYRANDIGLLATDQPQPVCVRGTVISHVSHVVVRPSGLSTIPGGDETWFRMEPEQVRVVTGWRPVSGNCRVILKTNSGQLSPGDRVQVVGKLQRPFDRSNPGGRSRFERACAERELCRLIANHSECIMIRRAAEPWNPRWWMAKYRMCATQQLFDYLGRERGELAAALLLGTREYLDPERVDSFFLTGTIHLLAISGLHVGILAWGLFQLVRLSFIPRTWALVGIMVLTVGYAGLTGGRAPVTRATILVLLVCGQLILYRRAVSFNGLAAAALVVLAWNPTQLTQVGAQLSFVAVAALIWAQPYWRPSIPTDPIERLKQQHLTRFELVRQSIGTKLKTVACVSAVVWIATLPLVMYRFHLVTPSALILNLFLWLPIAVALFLGFGVLAFAGWLSPLARICALGCSKCLGALEDVVQFGCSLEGSHFWTAGPSWIVVCVFYGLVALGIALPPVRRRLAWWAPAAALMVGLSTYANSNVSTTDQLRCSFLSLRCGTAVVLQLPDGGVWLYDAGSLGSPHSAVQEISSFLWSRRITRLDGLIISHADADHYNAVPGLLQRFAIKAICISPGMMNDIENLPVELQLALRSSKTNLRVIEAGTQITASDSVEFHVLHPRADSLHCDDNANSLVVLVSLAGHRILLPGDLERDGMRQLLAQPSVNCDVALAPHHGSRYGLPDEFCAWCDPEWVVISGGQIYRAGEIVSRYDRANASVLHTAVVGLVEAVISGDSLRVTAWRDE